MKNKKVLPLILLLFVAIMLFSVGMIVKEHRELQQDIKPYSLPIPVHFLMDEFANETQL